MIERRTKLSVPEVKEELRAAEIEVEMLAQQGRLPLRELTISQPKEGQYEEDGGNR